MTRIFSIKRLLIFIAFLMLPNMADPLFAADDPNYDDPFYGKKGADQIISERSHAPFQDVQESVDTFNGNVNLLHTDVVLPGNGGMDLTIQRAYNSRIWGKMNNWTGQSPGLPAYNDRSVMGVGWSFHFGRIVNPYGAGSADRQNPDNPIVEMPDGSSHPLYLDSRSGAASFQKVTRDYWIYRDVGSAYELVLTDGTVYNFPKDYYYFRRDGVRVLQVGAIKDTFNNTITFTYDAADRRLLKSISDTTGRTVTFGYSTITSSGCVGSEAALTSMSVNGQTYTFSYKFDCVLLLTEVRPPVGPSWKYEYDSLGTGSTTQLYELKKLTYPSGATVSYAYQNVMFDTGLDSVEFKVVTARTVGGRGVPAANWAYSYNANSSGQNQVTTVSRPDGNTERYTYASFGSLPDSGMVNALWKIGMILKKEILQGSTAVQTETYNWSPSPAISDDDTGSGKWNNTVYLYDYQIYVPRLNSRTVSRDGKTSTTTYNSYDGYGNPLSITETGDATRTTDITYFYNTSSNIVKGLPDWKRVSYGGDTDTLSNAYHSDGFRYRTNHNGVITTFTDNGDGDIGSKTDARGYTTSYQYAYGSVSRITMPNSIYSISREINRDGTIKSETNGRGYTTSFLYDGLGRLTQITPPAGAATTIAYDNSGATYWKVTKGATFTQYNVDGLGRVTSTSASEGINTSTTYNALGQKSYQSYLYTTANRGDNFTYDVLGRVKVVTRPDAKTQSHNYSNGNVAITNERGITTTYGYTAFGDPDDKLLTSVADATGTTSYTYNAAEQLKTITHPGGLTRSFGYDSRKFLTSETNPETGTISYGRDEIGNMNSRTNGKGTTSFTYDPLNRLTFIDYPGTADDTTFGYDNADNRTAMSSPSGAFSFAYDAINRMTQKSSTISGKVYTTTFGYDDRSNLNSLGYPGGRTIAYTYDSANRTTGLTGYVSNVTYHPSGGMAGFTYANGKTTTVGYDPNRYWVSSMNIPSVMSTTYGYDGVGNVQSIADSLNSGKNRSLGYDNVDRLTSASGVWGSMSFGYDAVGNRTSKTVNGSTTNYGYANNRVSSISGAETDAYDYDGNGNVTSIRGISLAYDYANRLTSVNGGSTTYAYDGDGMRIKKTGNGKTTVYHYDAHGNILSESDDAGVFMTDYLYLNGKLAVKAVLSPNALSGLVAQVTAVTPTPTVQLSWTDTNNGTADTIIERKVSGGAYVQIAMVTRPAKTFTDTQGLLANTTYYYRVKATNVTGVSEAYSSEASAVTTQYTITASAGANGVITPTGDLVVFHGGSIALTATANSQYHLTTLTVDGNPVVAAANKTSYAYTFSNVAANHSISATFAPDQPDIIASPSSLSFATLVCGNTSSAQTVTILNAATATAPLFISSATASGSEFLIQSNNCTGAVLAAGGSCNIQVAFKPAYKWQRGGNLSIASNDPDIPTFSVPLTGTGADTCPVDPAILMPILEMLLE